MKTFAFLLVVTALATPALAQDTPRVTIPDVGHVTRPDTGYVTVPDKPQVTVPDTPQVTVPDTPRAAQPAPPAPPPSADRRPMPTHNVKVDVTITEQYGSAPPTKKALSLIVADGRQSAVRSNTDAPIAIGGSRNLMLNIDASVNVTSNQRVLLDLRFIYSTVSVMAPLAGEGRATPVTPEEKVAAAPRPGYGGIQDMLVFLLTPGVPVVAARHADAATDRTVTVEVKAEILK
ncbi:hypothetical protein [Luteitalea sp.]|uniref:hypothetical protein n=1 Tax=Luteitalea sp. TaxID=2004800 RepID=UPI0025C0AD11|nr:hypothetical protein [Luteitalea sp.]